MTAEIETELQRRLAPANRKVTHGDGYSYMPPIPAVQCADGFSMSVQANSGNYCNPRNDRGPWWAVEIGFPSAKVDRFIPYMDGDPETTDPTATVYGYVPLHVVVDVIAEHGGFA